MNLEKEVLDEPTEINMVEDIDTNSNVDSGLIECEEITDATVNIGYDEDGSNDDSIIGKVFNTLHDVYTFYNRYAFLHGFGIRCHWRRSCV